MQVSFNVTNTGKVRGDEVVQLYVHDCLSSITVYEKVLRGFERISLEPGETRTVEFKLAPKDLAMLDRDMNYVVEPGDFEIMAAASSTDIRLQALRFRTERNKFPFHGRLRAENCHRKRQGRGGRH